MSPSVNHSYICTKIIEHLLKREGIQPFVELTLDIDKGMTPDIRIVVPRSFGLKGAGKRQAKRKTAHT